MIKLNYNAAVTAYPYRTARLIGWGLRMERDEELLERLSRKSSSKWDRASRSLIKVSGVEPDNHIVFSIGTTNIWFEDGEMLIGGEIELLG